MGRKKKEEKWINKHEIYATENPSEFILAIEGKKHKKGTFQECVRSLERRIKFEEKKTF